MSTKITKNTSPTIRKSNELIEARYRLSVWEQRLIFTLLVSISKQDEDFKRYRIRVADFAKQWQLESDNSLYEKVQDAADSLVGKTIQLSDDPAISKTVSWLAYVEYVKGSGEVEMEFHSSLKPYLLQLKGYYTEYQFAHVVNFKNQYTARIYELLRMEVFKHPEGSFSKTLRYDELRQLLALGKKEYAFFKDFRLRIIEPSVKEISTYTDLNIEAILYGKTGRKVTDITFTVKIRSPEVVKSLQAEDSLEPNEATHPLIERLIQLGFAIETAKKYKTKYGVKRIERNIAYALAKKQAGLVKDLPAYLNLAISEDMGGAWEVAKVQQAQDKQQENLRLAALDAQAEKAHAAVIQQLLGDKPVESTKIKPNTVKVRDLKRLLDD